MARITLIALLSVTAGCNFNRGTRWDEGRPTEGRGSFSGYITLPADLGSQSERTCKGIDLRVLRVGELEVLGVATATWRNGRCAYQVIRLPDDGTKQSINIRWNADWRCADGTAPVPSPAMGWVKMIEDRATVQDFRFTCPAATPAVTKT